MIHTRLLGRINEVEAREFFQLLHDNGHVVDQAAGVTRKLIGEGTDGFTEPQFAVLEREVLDVYVTEQCSLCSGEIPWSEMYAALENNGLCARCENNIRPD